MISEKALKCDVFQSMILIKSIVKKVKAKAMLEI